MQIRVGMADDHVNLFFYWINEAYAFWDKCSWQAEYQLLREHDLSYDSSKFSIGKLVIRLALETYCFLAFRILKRFFLVFFNCFQSFSSYIIVSFLQVATHTYFLYFLHLHFVTLNCALCLRSPIYADTFLCFSLWQQLF